MNRRAKVRDDMCACSARTVTDRSRCRFSVIQSSSGAIESSVHSGSGVATYCACPPSRCGGTTMPRAIVLATCELRVPHDVQDQIDAGGSACARQHRVLVDIQHIAIDSGRGIHRGEPVCVPPMGGAAAVVEKTGGGEDESARAQTRNRSSPIDRAPQFLEQRLEDGEIGAAPAHELGSVSSPAPVPPGGTMIRSASSRRSRSYGTSME